MDNLCIVVVREVRNPECSVQTETHEKQPCSVTQNPEGFCTMEIYGHVPALYIP